MQIGTNVNNVRLSRMPEQIFDCQILNIITRESVESIFAKAEAAL